jgi:hypothetical protein
MVKAREQSVAGAGSALVQPDAKQLLERAAEAAGLTLPQLIDLVRDSGALATPPDAPDGVTKPVTLGELGKRMWGEIQHLAKEDRPAWFAELLPPQQIAIIVTCKDRGYRPEVIAFDLGIPAARVREVVDQYADRIGAQVTQIRLSTIAGHVQLAAERAMQGLNEKEDWKGYFGVQKDVVKVLQSLGIVDQAIHRVEVTHKMEDTTQAEIEAMLEIERKKQRRLDEIAAAQGSQLDAVPKLEFENEP